ncbi:hypothetical protein ACWIGI_38825 [Nocardia sp. NPDC055321]
MSVQAYVATLSGDVIGFGASEVVTEDAGRAGVIHSGGGTVSMSELATTRADLLRLGDQLIDEADRCKAAGNSAGKRAALRELHAVKQRYVELLPDVAVTRCPDSNVIVRHAIDTVDLDGWFWDYDNPHRRLPELPATWLTMCGAMLLREPVAMARFWCRPGPGAPYVIPRILAAEGVRAVINEIQVGSHCGWAISYFGPWPAGVMLDNTWGANYYDVYGDDGSWRGWHDHESRFDELDFDLRPWVDGEKLLWVERDDPDVNLRTGVTDCPYLDVDGDRRRASIFGGEVRHRD